MANFDPQIPLLSFIFRLYTDVPFQAAFKEDPEAAMDEYGLTWEQKVAIYHSGADPMFVTNQPVEGYPVCIDPKKANPNPVSGDWWAAYACYKAQVEAGGPKPPPVPNPRGVNDRAEGDPASMAGVMHHLSAELSKVGKWHLMW